MIGGSHSPFGTDVRLTTALLVVESGERSRRVFNRGGERKTDKLENPTLAIKLYLKYTNLKSTTYKKTEFMEHREVDQIDVALSRVRQRGQAFL